MFQFCVPVLKFMFDFGKSNLSLVLMMLFFLQFLNKNQLSYDIHEVNLEISKIVNYYKAATNKSFICCCHCQKK